MATNRLAVKEEAHLLDYIRVLLKRLWLIVGFFTIVVGVVGFATYRATPMYRATATINIRQPNVALRGIDPSEILQTISSSQVYLNTQYKLLAGKAILERMVETKNLADLPEFAGMSTPEITRSLGGKVTVEPQRNTTLVLVSVEDSRRSIVHLIVNRLVDTFKERQSQSAKSSLEGTLSRLENKWLRFQSTAEFLNNDVNLLLEENNTDRETFLHSFDNALERLREKQNQLEKVDNDLISQKPLYDQIEKALGAGNGNGGGLEILFRHPVLLADPEIEQYEDELLLLRRSLMAARQSGAGAKRPEVLTLERAIADKEALLKKKKETYLLGKRQGYDDLQSSKALYVDQLNRALDDFKTLSGVKREYDAKMAKIEHQNEEFDRYFSIWEKLELSRKEDFTPVTIEDPATQPFAPFKPDKQLNMILAIVFGLFGGVGLAFFLEYMDDTVKTKEELQRITDVPLFGVIPNISARGSDLSKRDLYAYSQPKSTISEAFRGIRTAISYSSQKKENRVYLISSAGPKEGKTTIAINVATVMAYSGTRTLLVDADLRKPRVHKSFDLQNVRGLTNLIIGDARVEDVVQRTSVEKLDVLPSGPIPPNPSELLGRERMLEVLEELRSHYDRILLDTPPIGAVTDAAVLGRIVDSVILVVHAGKTRKKLIERGLEQLAQIDVDVSGIVLNNLKIGRKRYYPGYYHYYYYYSSYYGADEKRKPRPRDKSGQKV